MSDLIPQLEEAYNLATQLRQTLRDTLDMDALGAVAVSGLIYAADDLANRISNLQHHLRS
jgi:hypothetical protein